MTFVIITGKYMFDVCLLSVVVTVDNKPIRLQLCDTAGQVSTSHPNTLFHSTTNVMLMFDSTDLPLRKIKQDVAIVCVIR